MNIKHLVTNNPRSRKKYNVPETTEILMQYGISNTDKRTRELIREGRLVASKPPNTNPRDRRTPYEIKEKDIYNLIVTEIPIMAEFISELTKKTPAKTTVKDKPKEESAKK